MSTDVELVKERSNIVDIVGEYVKLTKAGANYKGLCPFHNEKTPSFTVNEEKQMYHCFGCSNSGDALSFVMELDNLDFREALTMLADRAGVELTNTGSNPQARELKQRLQSIMEDAARFYQKQLWDGAGKTAALSYLRDRGVRDETFKKFRLGFAPDGWRNLYDFLVARGYTPEEMLGGGLIINKEGTDKHYDRFRNRIMFPITDHFGATIGFTARVMPGDDEAQRQQAKYINTPETLLYHKSAVLYGIDQAKRAIKDTDAVLIVEGNMDVIAAHDADVTHTVAVSGTALTQDHLTQLARYTKHAVLFFDNDAAGQAALIKSVQMCFAQEFRVSVIESTQGKDAADMVKADRAGFAQLMTQATEAMAYFVAHAQEGYTDKSPEEKKSVAQELLGYVAAIKSPIVRDEWVREIATRFHIDEKVLFDELQVATSEQQRFAPHAQEVSVPSATPTQQQDGVQSRAMLIEQKIVGLIGAFPHLYKKILTQKDALSKIVQMASLKKCLEADVGEDEDTDTMINAESLLEGVMTEESFVALRVHIHEASELFGEKTEQEREKVLDEYITNLSAEDQRSEKEQVTQAIRSAEADGDTQKVQELMKKLSALG